MRRYKSTCRFFLLLRLVNVVAVLVVVLYYTVTLSVFCIFRTKFQPTTERSLWGLENAVSVSSHGLTSWIRV